MHPELNLAWKGACIQDLICWPSTTPISKVIQSGLERIVQWLHTEEKSCRAEKATSCQTPRSGTGRGAHLLGRVWHKQLGQPTGVPQRVQWLVFVTWMGLWRKQAWCLSLTLQALSWRHIPKANSSPVWPSPAPPASPHGPSAPAPPPRRSSPALVLFCILELYPFTVQRALFSSSAPYSTFWEPKRSCGTTIER